MSTTGDGQEIDLTSRQHAIAEADARRWHVLRFRKRPVEIEAVQFGLAEYADDPWHAWRIRGEEPKWLVDAAASNTLRPVFKSEDYWYFEVETLEGVHLGGPDDWLICGVEGELYFCKDRIFRATYEPVE